RQLCGAADHVQLALERVGVEPGRRADEQLADAGRARGRGRSRVGDVDGHIAPSEHALALRADGALEERLVRVEADADAVQPAEVEAGGGAEEAVWKLEEDPGAVAGDRVGGGRAPVLEVADGEERAAHRLVRAGAVGPDDERDAARVVLERRIVEAVPPAFPFARPGGREAAG